MPSDLEPRVWHFRLEFELRWLLFGDRATGSSLRRPVNWQGCSRREVPLSIRLTDTQRRLQTYKEGHSLAGLLLLE